MDIVFNRLAGALFRRLEKRAHIHVKAQVGKCGGHHFGATVMAVLAEFGNHHTRTSAFFVGKRSDIGFELVPIFHRVSVVVALVVGGGVNAGHFLGVGAVAAEYDFERITDLAHGCAQAHRFDRQVEQVTAMSSSKSQRFECGFDSCVVARGFDLLQTCNLSIPHRDVVDIARVNRIFGSEFVFVHANDHILTRVNPRLFLCGGGFDFELGPTAVDRFGHAAHGFHFFDDGPGFVRHLLCQRLHHVATGPGVDHIGDVGFFLDDELRVAGYAR